MDLVHRALLLALAKIRWPDSKHRLMAYVIANDQGAALGTVHSQADASQQTGISRSLVRKYLAELVDERVLHRHDGGGPRGHAYAVNRSYDEWRVPWFGARSWDRDAATKREAAVGQLLLFLYPPDDRKTRTAARPVAPLTGTAARTGARHFGPSRATGRATDDDLAARPVAPLASASGASRTIPTELEPPNYLEGGSEQAELLLATISERGGAPIFGAPAKRVRSIVNGNDAAELIAAVRSAPPGLPITAYVDIVSQANARRNLPAEPPVPAPPLWQPPEYEPAAPPPEGLRDTLRTLRSRALGAPECETVDQEVPT